ncbi:MAG: hypothetical protein RIM84_23845 [Alphaproteobacteria bacterium]
MVDRSLALLGIGLVLGGLAGFLVAAGNGITLDGHDHERDHGALRTATAAHAGHAPHGELLSLPSGPGAPTLAIAATPDAGSGWNLHVQTTNFRFAPTRASGPHVAGEGHAHVYVDGIKVARVYAPWLHIDDLPAGTHVVAVTLNANDHRALAVDGVPLRAEATIEVD